MENNYKTEITGFGLKLRRSDKDSAEVSRLWAEDYEKKLREVAKRGLSFGQYVDLRGYVPAGPETQKIISDMMALFKELGGKRSVVIFESALLAMQIRRLAKESGMYEWERYLDIESYPDNFEQVGLAWVIDGIDPDD